MSRRRIVLVLGVLGLAALVAGGLVVVYSQSAVAPPAWADEYDLTAAPPEMIAPGTVVGTAAPDGWSHLVIKSRPRVRPGEVARIPDNVLPAFGRDSIVRMVAWLFTAFAADVVREHQGGHARYRLRAIGLGLGARANGNGGDVVVTLETAKKHNVEINLIKEQVLGKGYGVQKQSIVPLHGPSFALLDTPVTVRCGGKNRMIRYRYALLVDAETGALDVALWPLPDGRGECGDLTRAVWLEPNCIDEAEMIPDLDEFRFGIPNESAFAVDTLPPHRVEKRFPPELSGLVGKTRFTPAEARALETGLRSLAADPRP